LGTPVIVPGMGFLIFPWESDYVRPRAAAPLLSTAEAFSQAHRFIEQTGHRLKLSMERGGCTLRLFEIEGDPPLTVHGSTFSRAWQKLWLRA
jgi:hypothetical protein